MNGNVLAETIRRVRPGRLCIRGLRSGQNDDKTHRESQPRKEHWHAAAVATRCRTNCQHASKLAFLCYLIANERAQVSHSVLHLTALLYSKHQAHQPYLLLPGPIQCSVDRPIYLLSIFSTHLNFTLLEFPLDEQQGIHA